MAQRACEFVDDGLSVHLLWVQLIIKRTMKVFNCRLCVPLFLFKI